MGSDRLDPADMITGALLGLLDCPDLNLDETEPSTRKAIKAARTAIARGRRAELQKALEGLLDCPDLNMDSLDAYTIAPLTGAQEVLRRVQRS